MIKFYEIFLLYSGTLAEEKGCQSFGGGAFHPLSSGTLVLGRLLSSLPPFGGERGSLKGHETEFYARQPHYLLFSNKLFDRIATKGSNHL